MLSSAPMDILWPQEVSTTRFDCGGCSNYITVASVINPAFPTFRELIVFIGTTYLIKAEKGGVHVNAKCISFNSAISSNYLSS